MRDTIKTRILNDRNLSMGDDLGYAVFMTLAALGVFMGFSAGSFWLFVIMFVLGLVSGIVLSEQYSNKQAEEFKALCVDHDMLFREDLSNAGDFLFLGHSEEAATVLMRHPVPDIVYKRRVCDVLVNLDDVLNVELSVDQSVVYRAGPIAALSGAAVGGAIFGGAGAIVGSIASSRTGEGKIGSIALKLRIDDLDTPLIQVDFISEPVESSSARWTLARAEKWTNLIEVMRHRIKTPVRD